MQTAKLFKSGRRQAVRFPAEFRFEGNEVRIRRDSDTGEVILSPMNRSLAELDAVGKPVAPMDLLIAAHALAEDCTLVTADRAFTQVPDLTVEDWTVS